MGSAQHLDIAGAKGGSSKPKAPVESPDTLQSTNIASILLAVGEGEFDGTPTDRDIYLDNTPIMDAGGNLNFPGVKWEWRPGSIDQEYIKGIPAVENETTVNVELRSDAPFSRALTNIQLSRLRLRFNWPRLYNQDSNGNTNGYRIEYAIDVATDGGAYAEAHRGAVDGKSMNGYQRSVSIDLPTATSGWMFRVRRITPNANKTTTGDTMTIAGYTEIIDEKLRYPNTALLYIEFNAEQFQNIPEVTVRCKARRWPVPSNYDPVTRTYSGVWDGTFKQAWTNNPAFVTYGLCVEDRFGLGKRIKPWMVDKWEMYRIAQYCDQLVPDGLGGQEPRYLCDINLQGRAEAWALLRDLSAIYRGMVYWAQGSLFMQADMPRERDIDYVFTRSNVIDGDFVYGGAERDTHYSRALVSYDNPANNYDTDVIPVTDLALQRRYRDRPIELSAIGCTRASEAQRRGKWVLLSNNQDRTVTFRTGIEGRIPLPGYVIPVADELVAGRPNGGRISAAAGRVVTLDRDTPIKAGDRLIVNLPNGSAQARTVQSVAGRAVTVTTAYSVQPEPQLQWAIDYEDLAVQLFRVLKTSRTQEGHWEITALEFNPSKFAAIDTGAKLESRPISVIPVTTVAPPASVSLSSAYVVNQGIAVSTMTIAWPAVEGAVAYDVEWRKDDGNWVRLQRVGTTSVDVMGIYAGAYVARVRAVSAFDIMSIWKSSNLTHLKGKEGEPPVVAFLRATPLVYGTGLAWAFPVGAEDTERTEIWQSATNSLADAVKLGDFAYPQKDHKIHGLAAGVSFYYWARLVDRSGNVGPWYPDGIGVNGRSSSDQTEYDEYFKDKIGGGALYPELRREVEKISGDGPESVNGRIEAAKQELENLVTELTDPLEYVPTQLYKAGEAVRSGRRIYSAIVDVPAAANGSNAPPNSAYWEDIGSIAKTSAALASTVQKNTADISDIDGEVKAQASMLQGVQAAAREDNGEGDLAGALAGWDAQAKFAQEVRARASETEAMTERVTKLDASIAGNAASIGVLERVVADEKSATATRFTTLEGRVGENASSISELEETVATNEESSASRFTQIDSRFNVTDQAIAQEKTDRESAIRDEATTRANETEALGQRMGYMEASAAGRDDNGEGDLAGALRAWESTAKFAEETRVRATEFEAQAKRTETLEATVNVKLNEAINGTKGDLAKVSASVEQTREAVAKVDGTVKALTTIKAQTVVGNKTVMAGLAIGADGETSEILAFAQRFAIVDEVSGRLINPFVVQNNQVFINTAIINTAFIQQIIMGMVIRSEAVDSKGRPFLEINFKSGTFTLRGQDADGSTLLNNGGLYVYDANDVERTAVGEADVMAARYGMRTKNAAAVVTLDTTVTAIRSIKTVTVRGNGAWDQYFSIPEIKAGSFVVVQAPTAVSAEGVEAWWSPGQLHLRRAYSNTYNVYVMSYGDDVGSAIKYGVRARNDNSLVQIDNMNRVMTVMDSGSFPIGRRGSGDYIITNGATFKAPIKTIEQPYVFLTSDTGMMVCAYKLKGAPGNWTGFTVEGWFGGAFNTAYYIVKWMVGGYKASLADDEFGIRIKDASGERIFSTSDNLILLNGTPSADRFKIAGSDIVTGPTYWSSFQQPWTGDVNDYFLASSLITPFFDGYSFYDNPAGFNFGNRSVLQAYSGANMSTTNAAGVNGRTLFAGRPMRPL